MKLFGIAAVAALSLAAPDTFAEGRAYSGFSVDYMRSQQDGRNNSSSAATLLRTVRPTEHYGYEMQFGIAGDCGPYNSNTFVDISAIGFLPISDSKFQLYGKAGLADVYSRGSPGAANNFGVTYGAGVEFARATGDIRVGFQHLNVGNGTQSPSISTFLIGLTLLLN